MSCYSYKVNLRIINYRKNLRTSGRFGSTLGSWSEETDLSAAKRGRFGGPVCRFCLSVGEVARSLGFRRYPRLGTALIVDRLKDLLIPRPNSEISAAPL